MASERRSSVQYLSDLSRELYVKYRGQYSTRRLQTLAKYHRETSSLRATAIVALSTMPSLTVMALVDLIPLAPPSAGLDHNQRFIARFFLNTWVFSCLGMHDFRHNVGVLPYSNRRLLVSSTIVSIVTTGVYYLLARLIGFPLPYGMILVTPISWLPLMLSAFALAWARQVRDHPHHWTHIVNMVKYWLGQVVLCAAYPLYVLAILSIPSSCRVIMMFLLPVMKVLVRVGFSRALPHMRDEGPEVVTFIADVFSSLFITYALQSTALLAVLALMALDLAYMGLSLRDIHQMHNNLRELSHAIDGKNRTSIGSMLKPRVSLNSVVPSPWSVYTNLTAPSFLKRADSLISIHTKQQDSSPVESVQVGGSATNRLRPSKSVPHILDTLPPNAVMSRCASYRLISTIVRSLSRPTLTMTQMATGSCEADRIASVSALPPSLSSAERAYVIASQRFLHTMEYIMLLNYVEAAIPFVYGECSEIDHSLSSF